MQIDCSFEGEFPEVLHCERVLERQDRRHDNGIIRWIGVTSIGRGVRARKVFAYLNEVVGDQAQETRGAVRSTTGVLKVAGNRDVVL